MHAARYFILSDLEREKQGKFYILFTI